MANGKQNAQYKLNNWFFFLYRLAQSFLRLVDKLESGLLGQRSLVFCDVKMEHFGVSASAAAAEAEGGGFTDLRVLDGGDLLFKERQGEFPTGIIERVEVENKSFQGIMYILSAFY